MSELNPEQKRAAAHHDGPLLIVAGAGAGKTRVVVERIANLIKAGTPPEKILAVTFTNKAAQELKERIAALVGSEWTLSPYDAPKTSPFAATFHGLSLHIIKSFHERAGLPKRFSIFDRSDSLRAAKQAIKDAGFDPKELEPSRVISVMGKHKGLARDVEGFRAYGSASYVDEAIAEVWERYDALLKKEKALDFDDILLTAHTLLHNHRDIREHFQNAWSHIHVDEYQDTNAVQYEIIRALADTHQNLCVVGDIDQNIYSWRGASLEHMLNFEKDFPHATVVTLSQNYRSTKNILQAANDAIEKNVRRKEKVLITENEDGEPLRLAGLVTETEEARFIVEECRKLAQDGFRYEDMAVLYRANFQSRALEEAFLHAGIEYQVLGTRFFDRKEIKDALSYLRLAQNPESTSDLSRIINVPTRGIGKVTLAKILNGQEGTLAPKALGSVNDFRRVIEKIRKSVESDIASTAVKTMLEVSGLKAHFESGKNEDEERLENIKELVSVASKYDVYPPGEGIERLIEEAALQSDQDELRVRREEKPGVKLMTVHAAKGLEFPVVFVTGLEDGLFPHEKTDGSGDPEEERRLFYVALTRAEKVAYLTYALSRRIFGTRIQSMPSEFITELDPSLTRTVAVPLWERSDQQYPDDEIVID